MESTEINFEDSFYSALSDDNKFYVMRNFKCTSVKVINIGEGLENLEGNLKSDIDEYVMKDEEFKEKMIKDFKSGEEFVLPKKNDKNNNDDNNDSFEKIEEYVIY
jgi:hypothetical protein